jgi:YD repeat-containing protein
MYTHLCDVSEHHKHIEHLKPNAENRLVSWSGGGKTVMYQYDGHDRRVVRTRGTWRDRVRTTPPAS